MQRSNFYFALLACALSSPQVSAADDKVPPVVEAMAHSYIASHAEPGKYYSPQPLIEKYAKSFLRELLSPGADIAGQADASDEPYARGQRYWLEHPERRLQMLAEFGYSPVESQGLWSRGFERSKFISADTGNETWWIYSFRNASWSDLGPEALVKGFGDRRIRIIGYLSPKGRYGHMGQADREVLVTSFSAVQEDH